MWRRLSKTFRTGSGIWALFALGLLMFLLLRLFQKSRTTSPKSLITQILKSNGISERTALDWAAVSDHETGTWTSNLFRNANNLFGMRQPMKRYTLSKGPTSSGFASFNSLEDSVKDLLAYMDEFNYPKDFPDTLSLVTFMKSKGYFVEPLAEYYNSVNKRRWKGTTVTMT